MKSITQSTAVLSGISWHLRPASHLYRSRRWPRMLEHPTPTWTYATIAATTPATQQIEGLNQSQLDQNYWRDAQRPGGVPNPPVLCAPSCATLRRRRSSPAGEDAARSRRTDGDGLLALPIHRTHPFRASRVHAAPRCTLPELKCQNCGHMTRNVIPPINRQTDQVWQ